MHRAQRSKVTGIGLRLARLLAAAYVTFLRGTLQFVQIVLVLSGVDLYAVAAGAPP